MSIINQIIHLMVVASPLGPEMRSMSHQSEDMELLGKIKGLRLESELSRNIKWAHNMEPWRPRKCSKIWCWMKHLQDRPDRPRSIIEWKVIRLLKTKINTIKLNPTLKMWSCSCKWRHLKIHCRLAWMPHRFIWFLKTLWRYRIRSKTQTTLRKRGSWTRSGTSMTSPMSRLLPANKSS